MGKSRWDSLSSETPAEWAGQAVPDSPRFLEAEKTEKDSTDSRGQNRVVKTILATRLKAGVVTLVSSVSEAGKAIIKFDNMML